MNGYVDELESLLDDIDLGEFEERARGGRSRSQVRTPTARSSFQPRQAPSAASQSQVQAAARNLDGKIETLSNAVKALETKTNGIAADQDRATVALRKEITARSKTGDAVRADLQQTKLLAVLLPMITQGSVAATDSATGREVRVVTQSQNQFASFLPFLLLMGGGMSGGDASKGPLGDSTTTLLLLMMLNRP
jgi:hypothetical protein